MLNDTYCNQEYEISIIILLPILLYQKYKYKEILGQQFRLLTNKSVCS